MTENFLITLGLYGGALIGLSAGIMLIFVGRVAGISGILGGLLQRWDATAYWRVFFIAGIPLGAWLLSRFTGKDLPVELDVSTPQIIVAGLLVGFGTRLGSGCTSGHGVCGLARLSPRSVLATGLFMGAGLLTVYISRHLLGGGV